MMPRALRLLVAVSTALVLQACEPGPDETDVEPPTQEVAAESYAAEADEVCLATRQQLQFERTELFEREGADIEPADAQQSFERAAALVATELRDLRELEPPEGMAEDVRDWLDEVETAAGAYERAGESPQAAAELLDAGDPLLEAEATADELELGLCGSERIPSDELGDPRSVPTEDDEDTAPAIEDEG